MSDKIRLRPIRPHTVFFPSVDEFIEFLGFGVSARSKISWFEPVVGKISISDRSKDNLSKSGVSPKLARKVFWPIIRFLYRSGSLKKLRNFPKRVRAIDVIHGWMMTLEGFSSQDHDLNIQFLFDFFHYRNEHYLPARQLMESSPPLTDENKFELLNKFYCKTLPKTLLTDLEQAEVKNTIQLVESNGVPSEYGRECLLKWYFDFHLSFFAVLDIVIINNYEDNIQHDGSVFFYVLKCKGETYFSKLLSYLNEFMSISDYKLAQFIPIDREENKDVSTSLQDAQKKTLQEWRNGETKPRPKTLIRFYESFGDAWDYYPLLVISIICLALDRNIESQRMRPLERSFKATFSADHYARYFAFYKEKLPQRAAS